MKVTIQKKGSKTLTFPRLMQSTVSKAVYLITSMDEDEDKAYGMLISGKSASGFTIGKTAIKDCTTYHWDSSELVDFDDVITLQN